LSRIKCLLWDFGDTLCDERFIWGSGPEWMEVYETFDDDGLGAQWCLGEITTRDFSEALGARMNRAPESIAARMAECCRSIQYFPHTYDFFKSCHLPQAIVTVNPDLFSDVIVPTWNLNQYCGAIVTSWEERTDDKNILNRVAIERLGLDCRNSEALLIDNKHSNIVEWVRVGGAGYRHTGDRVFRLDSADGVEAMAALKPT